MSKEKVVFYYKDGKVELHEVDTIAERVDLPGKQTVVSARDFLTLGGTFSAGFPIRSFARGCMIGKSGRRYWFYEED